jgi:hypothetical protein
MTAVSIVSISSVAETRADDDSFKTILLFCCVGLIASLGLMTLGIDLGASWV